MTQPTIWNQVLVWPIINILIFIYKIFTLIGLPGAFGFSIIILTLIIRLILLPITRSQIKSAQKMQELKPKLELLAKNHARDKKRLQQEQLKLYQKEGINPVAGCLPLLLQMPVFIALYSVFLQILSSENKQELIKQINSVVYSGVLRLNSLSTDFFGIDLGLKPTQWQKYGVLLLLVPVITALLQYWQTKVLMPQQPAFSSTKKKGQEEDFSKIMQKQMNFMVPAMIGFFSYSFPLGLSLYWNAFTLFGIIFQGQKKTKEDILEDKNEPGKKS